MANPRGTFAGILCAWFGVPLWVLLGAIGGVTGAIAGFFSGTALGPGAVDRLEVFFSWIFPLPVEVADLIPDFAWQIGGMIGLVVGATYGAASLAWLAATSPWTLLYQGDPMWPISVALGQFGSALVLATVYTVLMVGAERARLCAGGAAREPSRRELEALAPILAECSQLLGMGSATPVLLISDSPDSYVQAGARHLVVSRGLLAEARGNAPRLTAVLGREMVHWREGRGIADLWSRGVALPLYLVYELAARLVAPSKNTRARPLMLIFRVLLWPVIVTVRWILIPLQRRFWRKAEFAADEVAAQVGWAEGLRDAITAADARPLEAGAITWERALSAQQAPTELRLAQLESVAGSHRDLWEDLANEQRQRS